MRDELKGDAVVRLKSPGPSAWRNVNGLKATQDDPFIEGLSESYAQALVSNHPFEAADQEDVPRVDRWSNWNEGDWLSLDYRDRVADVENGLVDDHLDEVEDVETSKTVKQAVEERRDDLTNS